jgi:hypothetical protein
VLTDEAFKFFCSDLLPFLLDLDSVIVTCDLLDRFPEHLDHFANIVGFTADICLLVLELLLLFDTTFSKFLTTHSDTLLGIVLFFFVFPIEVLLHPVHLFEEEFLVGATCGPRLFLRDFGFCWHLGDEVRADFFELGLNFVVF